MTPHAWTIAKKAIIELPRMRDAERRINGSGRAIATRGFLLSKRESRSAGLRAAARGASAAFVVPVTATKSDTALAGSEQAAGAPAPAHSITTDGGNER